MIFTEPFKFKNWRDNFAKKVLNQSEEYIETIKDVKFHGTSIYAHLKKSSHFTVSMTFENDEINYMYCTCPKNEFCKHEAAVLAYIEKNSLFEKEKDFIKVMDSVDLNLLKDYVTEIFNDNPELKKDFVEKFKKEPKIDFKPYFNKLERIISRSQGSDYINFGLYDIDVLASGIEDFLIDEVYGLMDRHQYEVVFELLDRIAEVLNDEMYTDNGYWYGACEEYLQIAYRLDETYVLSDEQMDRLYDNESFMNSHM